MTRFFAFVFVDETEVTPETNWLIKSESIVADGVIFAIIPPFRRSLYPLYKT